MFTKSLDIKKESTNTFNGNSYIDLTEGIFDTNKSLSQIYSIFKVPEQFIMRPDLISMSLYGTDIYTEMILKYSNISNPFSVNLNDIIYSVSLNNIYNPIRNMDYERDNTTADLVKKYHKYIDKNKVPVSNGSQSNDIMTAYKEPNISSTGKTGVSVENGRVYFGSEGNNTQVIDTDAQNAYRTSTGITINNGRVYFSTDNYTMLSIGDASPIVTSISADGNEITTVNEPNGNIYTTINTKTGQSITTTVNTDGTKTTTVTDTLLGTTRTLKLDNHTNTNSSGNERNNDNNSNTDDNIIGVSNNDKSINITADGNIIAVDESLTDLPQCECAENGMSLGNFLSSVINNTVGE